MESLAYKKNEMALVRGWKLYNYPERLAYSATPPDFGALLIQRRRWANGGLLIFPNLLRYLFNQPMRWRTIKEGLMRSHYLLSITSVNVGLVLLLFYPFDNQMNSLWLPLTALPYFALYGYDLTLIGYQWRDLPRVYAINLLLVPVHLGGVIQSMRQALTGQKTPFCRTPKVLGRTSVPALYIGVVYGMVVLMLVGAVDDYFEQYWTHMAFASMNAGFLMYSVFRYVGIQSSIEDLQLFTNQYILLYKRYGAAFLWSETSSQPNPTKIPEKVPGGIPD